MYVSSAKDTLYVDGVDIKNLPGILVNDIDLLSPGKKRGSNEVIPGRWGQIGVAKPYDAYAFSAEITVMSAGTTAEQRRGSMLTNLKNAGRLLQGFKGGGQVRLKRRLTVGEGEYEITVANGEYVQGTDLALINWVTGKTELEFINLDGCWYSESEITLGSFANSVKGDLATRQMVIDFPGKGTLTNRTTNTSLTVSAASTVDVTKYKTTAGLKDLSHSGDVAWFVLLPGVNDITWSGTGLPIIRYHSAHI